MSYFKLCIGLPHSSLESVRRFCCIDFFSMNSIWAFSERKSSSAHLLRSSWSLGSSLKRIFFLSISTPQYYLATTVRKIIASMEPQIERWINHKFLFCLDFSFTSGIYSSTNLHCVHEIIINPSVPWMRAFFSGVKPMLPHLVHFPFFISFTSWRIDPKRLLQYLALTKAQS